MTNLRMKLFATSILLLALGVLPARADTHAPNPQIFSFDCGGLTLTGISPNNNAKAGQFLESTDVGVAFLITFGGEVVYESPAYAGLPDGLLSVCTSDDFVFYFLATF
jgi:hypothetical protein